MPILKLILKPIRQRGFSLVELLVAMTLGTALVLLSSTLYFSSKASFRLNDEKLRLQQDGSHAMGVMAKNLRQAGFGKLASAGSLAVTDFIETDGQPAQGLRGCAYGFARPLGPGKDFSCSNAAGMAAFEVAYRTDDYADPASGAGVDCNGSKVQPIAVPVDHPAYRLGPQVSIAKNLFFVARRAGSTASALYCQGNGNNNSAQPLLNNVEQLQLAYDVADASPRRWLDASQVSALSDDQLANWKRVTSVRLCLQIRGDQMVSAEAQHYVDCDGAARVAEDRSLRQVFTSTVTLRSQAAAIQVPP
ncbi:prepilin-type N-terminal cleavage/methylation domain-containing protein [Collimonas pratensis]|uniref:PilW family protein n=1 Tax=Collimonas pratensis TaxID=279113 RepID=UPI00143D5C4E|nr:PilW family protein [Collimonas pratensis]NKI70707.1 prepilin-type N-terminal cleavage/methylation domain-containing protein [Collimonas pratensis]